MNQILVVHDVSQEYWYIKRQKCSYGGKLHPQGQQLLIGKDGKHFDSIETVCTECKSQMKFKFDVTNFHSADRSNRQAELMQKMMAGNQSDLYIFAHELTIDPVASANKNNYEILCNST